MNPNTHPENFTRLNVGDIRLEGDLYFSSGRWNQTLDVNAPVSTSSAFIYYRLKPKQKEPMKYYREIQTGEPLIAGDQLTGYGGMREADPGIAGVGPRDGQYLRPVAPPDEWISREDRMPKDADYIDGKILAQMQDGETCLYYQQYDGDVNFDDSDGIVAFWKRLTPASPKEKPIKLFVGQKEETVTFNGGHSLKIGCSNVTVSAETLREIADRIDGKS